jgi:hypothetical protein
MSSTITGTAAWAVGKRSPPSLDKKEFIYKFNFLDISNLLNLKRRKATFPNIKG